MNNKSENMEWTCLFYEELNPDKRLEILNDNLQESVSEAAKLRERLWVARYGKRKPKNDAFVGYLMNLKYIAESGTTDIGGKKKKMAAEVIHGLQIYEYEKKSECEQSIIFEELKNTCRRFIDVSARGRGFTSVLFGMGQLSDESVAKKIAEQLSLVVFTAPHMLRMDREFAILQRAAVCAFRDVYPNREHFLRKV